MFDFHWPWMAILLPLPLLARYYWQRRPLDDAHEQTYCVAGKEAYPYTEILDIITRGLGLEPKPKVPNPIWLVRPAIHGLGKFGLLPISPDQFEMLLDGNTCDSTAFYQDFDVVYRPFTPENLAYLKDRA